MSADSLRPSDTSSIDPRYHGQPCPAPSYCRDQDQDHCLASAWYVWLPSSENGRADETGDQLYAGCADGSLRVYSLVEADDESPKLLETHQIGRRQIDQVGVLPEAKQLVVLTGELRRRVQADKQTQLLRFTS